MTPFKGTSTCIETARPLQLLEVLSSVCALVFLSSRSLTSLQTSGGPLTSSRITPDSLLPFVHLLSFWYDWPFQRWRGIQSIPVNQPMCRQEGMARPAGQIFPLLANATEWLRQGVSAWIASSLSSLVCMVCTPCKRAASTCRALGIPCMFKGQARMVRLVARPQCATFARVKHSWSWSRFRSSPLRKVDCPCMTTQCLAVAPAALTAVPALAVFPATKVLGRPTVATPDSIAFLAIVFGAAGGACLS